MQGRTPVLELPIHFLMMGGERRIVPPRDGVQASPSLEAVQGAIAETRSSTQSIFNCSELRRVSDGLDWNASPRLPRDSARTLKVHGKTLPDENLRYRIFDLANRVVRYSKLPDALQQDVLNRCASVLFYDHGYKAVHGMSKFDRIWKARLEDSYQSGGDLHPLRGRYKGKEKYTNKFDAENPGGVLKCFRAAQKVVGNEASFADLAAVMNAKAEEEDWTMKGENCQRAKNV